MEIKWEYKRSDPTIGRVDFVNISNSRQYAKVEISDVTTQTVIHQDTRYWEPGINYWICKSLNETTGKNSLSVDEVRLKITFNKFSMFIKCNLRV